MSAIQRHDGPSVDSSQLKNGSVGERLPGLAGIGNGDHIVTHSTQCFDDWERKVLVSEERRATGV
jgi:hypothetical protein